jgi:predicted acyl esterase
MPREGSMTEKHNDIEMIQERDVLVRMRDGVHLSVDVYRPTAPGKYPALFASALHNKDN